MARREELSEKVDTLVALARAHRIRDAWTEAARRLGLEHRVATRLFDDVLEGVIDGVPVRVEHLPLREMRRLHTVVRADTLGALPRELMLDPREVLEAYDRACEDEVPPSSRRDGPPSSVYREAERGGLDVETRRWLGGTAGDSMGAAARDGKIIYQHAGPMEDGATLAALLSGVAKLAVALSRALPAAWTP